MLKKQMQKQIKMLEYDFSDYYGEEEEQTNGAHQSE